MGIKTVSIANFGGGSKEDANAAIISETGMLTISYQTESGAIIRNVELAAPAISLADYEDVPEAGVNPYWPSTGELVLFIDNQTEEGTLVAYIGTSDGGAFPIANSAQAGGVFAGINCTDDTKTNAFAGFVTIGRTLAVTGFVSAASYKTEGEDGVSGSFTSNDGKAITVTNGIITDIS